MAGILFGPVPAAIVAALADILGALLFPIGAYYPPLTITSILVGLTYGFFLYKKPIKVTNVVLSQLVVKIVCNIVLNTLWLNMLYGQAVAAILPGRLVSNAVMLPIDSFIMYVMLNVVNKVIRPYFD